MKNISIFKFIAFTLSITTFSLAYASFTYYDPLENNKGGSLPDGSIGFKNGNTGGGNTGGGNGTGGGNSGEGSGNEGSGNGGGEEQSLASKQCDDSAEKAKVFFNTEGLTYVWHTFSLAEETLPDRCQIIYEMPIMKSWECTGDMSYVNSVQNSLTPMGIDTAAVIPVGECP